MFCVHFLLNIAQCTSNRSAEQIQVLEERPFKFRAGHDEEFLAVLLWLSMQNWAAAVLTFSVLRAEHLVPAQCAV